MLKELWMSPLMGFDLLSIDVGGGPGKDVEDSAILEDEPKTDNGDVPDFETFVGSEDAKRKVKMPDGSVVTLETALRDRSKRGAADAILEQAKKKSPGEYFSERGTSPQFGEQIATAFEKVTRNLTGAEKQVKKDELDSLFESLNDPAKSLDDRDEIRSQILLLLRQDSRKQAEELKRMLREEIGQVRSTINNRQTEDAFVADYQKEEEELRTAYPFFTDEAVENLYEIRLAKELKAERAAETYMQNPVNAKKLRERGITIQEVYDYFTSHKDSPTRVPTLKELGEGLFGVMKSTGTNLKNSRSRPGTRPGSATLAKTVPPMTKPLRMGSSEYNKELERMKANLD